MIQLRHVGDDALGVQVLHLHHVLGFQQGRDLQLGLRNIKGKATVVQAFLLVEIVKVYEVWSKPGDDGAEGEARSPGVGEVSHVDSIKIRSDLLGPG